MKIQCSGCEAAEAAVLCCADEAALCWACDEKVHAANKLASKHQRIPLVAASSPSRVPKCDICQEAPGYFFCLEDRALFCRNCDVAVHTANPYVSAHRRFLLTGVQVGLEPAEPIASAAKEQPNTAGRVVESPRQSLRNESSSTPFSSEANQTYPGQVSKDAYFALSRTLYAEAAMSGSLPNWSVDDLFEFTDFNQSSGFSEHVTSKADSGKLGSSEGSPPNFLADGISIDEYMGQVPEISYDLVPEIPSPPTASGLHWQKNPRYSVPDHSFFVPDISSSCDFNGYQTNTKRHRSCLVKSQDWGE